LYTIHQHQVRSVSSLRSIHFFFNRQYISLSRKPLETVRQEYQSTLYSRSALVHIGETNTDATVVSVLFFFR